MVKVEVFIAWKPENGKIRFSPVLEQYLFLFMKGNENSLVHK